MQYRKYRKTMIIYSIFQYWKYKFLLKVGAGNFINSVVNHSA